MKDLLKNCVLSSWRRNPCKSNGEDNYAKRVYYSSSFEQDISTLCILIPVLVQGLLSHGSCSSSFAVFLSSGRHCNIAFTNLMNLSLFSPSRKHSFSSRVVDSGIGTSFRHLPARVGMLVPATKVQGKQSIRRTVSGEELTTASTSLDQIQWWRAKQRHDLGEVSAG